MLRFVLFLTSILAYTLATAQGDFNSLTDKGYQELFDGKPAAAKQTLEQALKVLPDDLDTEQKGDFFNNLGVAYYQTGSYKKGLDAYEKALEIYQRLHNDSIEASAILNLGLAYKEIGASKQAISLLTKAARLDEKYGNQQELSSAWNAIGNIQLYEGNFEKALDYHQRALKIRQRIGYDKGTADSYNNIGQVYLEWKQYDKAEYYLLKALDLKKKLSNQSNVVNTLSALGELYVATNEPKKAKAYLDQAYELNKEAGNSPKTAASMYYLGTYYASQNNRPKALELFRQVQDICKNSRDYTLLSKALLGEINLLKQGSEGSVLITKYQELTDVRDRIALDENRKEIARLEIEYDVERKEREIDNRRKQAKLDKIRIENDALRKQQLTGWVIGLSLVVITVVILLYQIRRRKHFIELQNRELEQQRDEITHLHQELSHRTKNYFGLLGGILKSDKSQVKHPEATKILEENIRRLEAMSLVQKYLLDSSSQQNKEVRLDIYLQNVVDSIVLTLLPRDNNLVLDCKIEPIYLDYDVSMRLAIALNELICNAIEHAFVDVERPELTISVKRIGNQLEMIVKDNGPGISDVQLNTEAIKGRNLIRKLLYKLEGTVQYHNQDGCVVTVVIKV